MKKALLLSAAVFAAVSGFAASQEDYLNSDYYMIGSNVNGKTWSLSQEDAKFKNDGGGIFVWEGEYLGNGFKINNGNWVDDYNFGAGESLVLGETYYIVAAGSSGNINFAEDNGVAFSGLKNPKVVLDVSKAAEGEITIVVTGEKDGVIEWFFTGSFNGWDISDTAVGKLTDLGNKKYEVKGLELTLDEESGVGEFKITSTGWGTQFGGNDDDGIPEFLAGVDEGELFPNGGEGGAAIYYGEGVYDIEWNGETHWIKFIEAGEGLVNEISAVNGEAVYYNLQGVRVANPENGLFIQSVNGKATKVLIRK